VIFKTAGRIYNAGLKRNCNILNRLKIDSRVIVRATRITS